MEREGTSVARKERREQRGRVRAGSPSRVGRLQVVEGAEGERGKDRMTGMGWDDGIEAKARTRKSVGRIANGVDALVGSPRMVPCGGG